MRKIDAWLAGPLVPRAVIIFRNVEEPHAAVRGNNWEQGRDGDVRERLSSVHGLAVEVGGVSDKVGGDGVSTEIE